MIKIVFRKKFYFDNQLLFNLKPKMIKKGMNLEAPKTKLFSKYNLRGYNGIYAKFF